MIGQHLLNGLMQGTIYGLVAMGFTIFFGVMNVIKFSHGDVLTLGAFGGLVAVWATHALGLAGAGSSSSPRSSPRCCFGGRRRWDCAFPDHAAKHAPPLNMLLMTMMIGTVLRECIRLFFPNGTNPQTLPGIAAVRWLQTFRQFVLPHRCPDPDLAGVASIGAVSLDHQPHPAGARNSGRRRGW